LDQDRGALTSPVDCNGVSVGGGGIKVDDPLKTWFWLMMYSFSSTKQLQVMARQSQVMSQSVFST
jgi:hypothetical protein